MDQFDGGRMAGEREACTRDTGRGSEGRMMGCVCVEHLYVQLHGRGGTREASIERQVMIAEWIKSIFTHTKKDTDSREVATFNFFLIHSPLVSVF